MNQVIIKALTILLIIPSLALANPKEAEKTVVLIDTNESQGSGVIISPNGLIITSAHVIKDRRSIRVYIGNKPYIALASYIDKESDIALLKIEQENLIYAKISYDYEESDKVYSISNPKGYRNVYNEGEIKEISLDKSLLYITTSNIVNHGSSGGAIFNQDGELISTIHAILESGDTLSIPVLNFKLILEHYINNLI